MTGTNKPRIYISGPLQAAPDLRAARRFYEELALICRRHGYDPYLPHQRTDPSLHRDAEPSSVFLQDLRELRDSSVILAAIGTPSGGVGAELAFAYLDEQPVIAIWQADERPSRFIEGMLREHAHATFIRYENDADLAVKLGQALDRLRNAVRQHVG